MALPPGTSGPAMLLGSGGSPPGVLAGSADGGVTLHGVNVLMPLKRILKCSKR